MSAAMTTEVKALGGGNRSCEGSEWLTDTLLKSHDGSQPSDGFEQRCKKALHLALNLNDANVALGSHRASGSDLKASPTTVTPPQHLHIPFPSLSSLLEGWSVKVPKLWRTILVVSCFALVAISAGLLFRRTIWEHRVGPDDRSNPSVKSRTSISADQQVVPTTVARKGDEHPVERGTAQPRFSRATDRAASVVRVSAQGWNELVPSRRDLPKRELSEIVVPSADVLALSDEVSTDPDAVLTYLEKMEFRNRPRVDRTFAKYLEALARFQKGEHNYKTLALMDIAYHEAATLTLTPAAHLEMARNLVLMLRATEKDWEQDPLLKDPQVQAARMELVPAPKSN
jgi:hypothetical protein